MSDHDGREFQRRFIVSLLPNGCARIIDKDSRISGLFSPATGELTGDIRHVLRVEKIGTTGYVVRVKPGR